MCEATSSDVVKLSRGSWVESADADEQPSKEVVEYLRRCFVAINLKEGRLVMSLSLDELDDFLVIPLQTLIEECADDCTPGEGGGREASPLDVWRDVEQMVAVLRGMADQLQSRVEQNDRSGQSRAWGWLEPLCDVSGFPG